MKVPRKITIITLVCVMLASSVFAAESDSNWQASSGNLPEIVNPYTLYTYEQMLSDIAALKERYPSLISVSSIGKSVEGRDIPVFTLGTGKREILICASMHAREYVTTNFVMYMTEQYCKGYVNNEAYYGIAYRQMLDNVRFVIVPMLNPDGVVLCQYGIEYAARKDTLSQMMLNDTGSSGYYAWKANINGVDLNRNWPYNWTHERSTGTPSAANYNGVAALTEPEVIAMNNLITSAPYYMLCSFHTSGEVIYWVDNTNSSEYYYKWYPFIYKIANWIGYTPMGVENISDFGGYMVNYARGISEKPCFTVELCPYYSNYPYSYYDYFGNTVSRVLPIGLLMAEAVMNMEKDTEAIDVKVEDNLVIFSDVRPLIYNSRTLVPLRATCEAAGLDVGWNAETNQITVTDGNKTVILTVNSGTMIVGDSAVALEALPCIINGRTMIPIRAVMEEFGYLVGWDDSTKTVTITPVPDTPDQEYQPLSDGGVTDDVQS